MLFARFKHYKGGIYHLLARSVHTETNERLVIYRSEDTWDIYARPSDMFFGCVEVDGIQVPRFAKIEGMRPVIGQLCTTFPDDKNDRGYVSEVFDEGFRVKGVLNSYYINVMKDGLKSVALHFKDDRPAMARKNIFGKYVLD